jgi:hypothetical protein
LTTSPTQTGTITWHTGPNGASSSHVSQSVATWAGEIGAGVTATVTVNFNATPTAGNCNLSEWSGLLSSSVVDAAGTSQFNNTGTTITASPAPTSGKIAVMFAVNKHGGSFTGWTGCTALTTNNSGFQFCYLTQTSTSGTYSLQAAWSTSNASDIAWLTLLGS